MKYFAYGSNMSLKRLQQRVPSAQVIGTYTLIKYELRFHKCGKDGSAKCNAYYTGAFSDAVLGVLYDINHLEKPALDEAEGLGCGYNDKVVTVSDHQGLIEQAVTYYATNIDDSLLPFIWYKEHVLIGAKNARLSTEYIESIQAVDAIKDQDQERESKQLAIYG